MLGILCGFEMEAKVARRLTPLVACSGAQEQLARERAEALVKNGARALLSFGVAGGLAPELHADHVIVASHVMSDSGRTWNTDDALTSQLARAVPEAQKGGVYGSTHLVPTPENKKNLFAQTGCLIVDMESHVIAEVATAHALPFAVLRGVSDGVEESFPPAALVGVNPDGSTNYLAVLTSLMKNPGQWPALKALLKNTQTALGHLQRAVPKIVFSD